MRVALPVCKNSFKHTIHLPGSKSLVNRALLLAALAEGQSTIHHLLNADDTLTFANGLQALGVELQWDKTTGTAIVFGTAGKFPAFNSKIWCREAGTVARFLLPAVLLARGNFIVDGSSQLRKRPIKNLLSVLAEQGAEFLGRASDALPVNLKTKQSLKGGNIFISGKESSQFLSGLLMVAPFAEMPMTLSTDHLVSSSYVEMTIGMMKHFGVSVECISADAYRISNQQKYQATEYTVEPDLSTATYFFAAAALLNSEVCLTNINFEKSLQGDRAFLSVLEKMGCDIQIAPSSITVCGPEKLQAVSVNIEAFSDSFMTLAILAPFCDAPMTLSGLAHTRGQESDRLKAVQTNLKKLGVQSEEHKDGLTIYPSTPKGCVLESFSDHRIAMAFSILGLHVPGVVINQAEVVSKSCPDFFMRLQELISIRSA